MAWHDRSHTNSTAAMQKPANIFYDARGEIKLGDFGLAKFHTDLGSGHDPVDSDGEPLQIYIYGAYIDTFCLQSTANNHMASGRHTLTPGVCPPIFCIWTETDASCAALLPP